MDLVFLPGGSNDLSSIVEFETPPSVSLPEVSEVQAEEVQELNPAETSSQALGVASPRDFSSSPTSVAEELVLNGAETSSQELAEAFSSECLNSATLVAAEQELNHAEPSSNALEVASSEECPRSPTSMAEKQLLNAAETSSTALEVVSPAKCPSSPTAAAKEQVWNAADTSSKALDVASPGECPSSPTLVAEDQLLEAGHNSSQALELVSARECPSSPAGADLSFMKESEGISTFLVPGETDHMDDVSTFLGPEVTERMEIDSTFLGPENTERVQDISAFLHPEETQRVQDSSTSIPLEESYRVQDVSEETKLVQDVSTFIAPEETKRVQEVSTFIVPEETGRAQDLSTFIAPEETERVQEVSTVIAPEETGRAHDVSTFIAPEETGLAHDVSTFIAPEETESVEEVSTSIAPEETGRAQDVSTFIAPEETERVQDVAMFVTPDETQRVRDVSTVIPPEEAERVQDVSMFIAPEEAERVQDVSLFIVPEEAERVQDVSTVIVPEEADRVQDVSTIIVLEAADRLQDVSTVIVPEETEREQEVSTVIVPEETEGEQEVSTNLVPEETDLMEEISTHLGPDERDRVEDYVMDEQQPAKRAKTSGTTYSGADAVEIVLGQTAEIVLVLAGMAQMRAGRIPTSYERELAATAYQNLGILVSQVAPNNLVTKESLERLLRDYNSKKVAQKRREDQAWVEAVTEAEALANAKVEAVVRAKAEAAARAQAEVAARTQADIAARARAEAAAKAEAEELQRRQQAALNAAAIAAANSPSAGAFSSVGASPLYSGQSAYGASDIAQPPSLPTPGIHANSEAEIGSQVVLPLSKVGEMPHLVAHTEKSMSVNGQPHPLVSKPAFGRPPKVRNRVRKEPASFTLFAPEFLNVVQSQVPDPQKAHVTHKELCLGVQQFIREHIPPVSQSLQALPPTYISTPIPCQVCKLIAKDTGSVLVCDSCDEVSHVKCVQPQTSRGASKGDWNCPKCLTASRGGKYPSKYGPILYGSPNSVKLWPPHDRSQGNPKPSNTISIGSVRREGEWSPGGRQTVPVLLGGRAKAVPETDTRPHLSMDDSGTGNFGSSPHLIVHLVNEPSPRTPNPLSSSQFQEDKQGPFPSGQSITSLEEETAVAKDLTKDVVAEKQTLVQGTTGTIMSDPSDALQVVQDSQNFEKGLDNNESQVRAGVVEDTAHETKNRRATPAHIKKAETRALANQSKKGNTDSEVFSPSKPAEVPLPIVMEWVGDSVRRAEGKIYYRACSVGGITFSVSDCALFRPETPDVPPYIARLQVLWEDIATGHKWVRVSWCYYPSDIPMAMGRPGSTAPDEVYESNHCDNNLVGAIQGPCFVLPPLKFIEETERRRTLEKRGDAVEELPPIFLSRCAGVFMQAQGKSAVG